ncbi:ABC transporter permease [Dermatophilus congolensis]|uniref:ABC transporter permease n=4 Tax=Dermatophilus congolensis TaxID=1863 RepID=UPI001AAF1B51|nr:ABC transporter permease [Dermatophilus congolensis]MBO3142655.1 ABC transporter permease [Dermatophilus congolensis]MBO3176480.1 ABC transporter permease [Dermatophilus congolensis]MBO3183243.1 ABC transporter permease [Dermatophilus congolensis]MBO3205757.1 ABC transporter permease [Dermatophilus congolensis]MBO3217748.1 ABC transporter permease [Dermatophilus congolensis]
MTTPPPEGPIPTRQPPRATTPLQRIINLAASLLAASILVFTFMNILPGDPARIALGLNASDEAVAALRTQYGLDRPLTIQYIDWVHSLITLDLGNSYVTGAAITPQILDRAAVTCWLVAAGLAIALLISIPAGIHAALRHRHADGIAISTLSQIGVSLPSFLVAIILVTLLSVHAGLLPSSGWAVPAHNPTSFLAHLTLPALSLGLVQGAILTRYIRAAVLETWQQDHIRTARSTGISTPHLITTHVLRNTAIPVITILGIQLASMLIGAVIIEQVFAIPGLGSLLLDAVGNRDLLVIQDVVMLLVIAILILNTLVDLLYTLLNPRIRVHA